MSREVLQMALEAGYKDLPTVRLAYQGFDIQHFTNLVIAAERHRVLAEERAALAQQYPEYDRGFSNGWDKCAERQAVQQEHPEQMARLDWQYVECPACGSEGARAFPKPEEQQSCDKQEPVAWVCHGALDKHDIDFDEDVVNAIPVGPLLYASPPQRQPLTHEQRLDLLTAFEPSKSSWNAESILIDMVEAKHGIGDKT